MDTPIKDMPPAERHAGFSITQARLRNIVTRIPRGYILFLGKVLGTFLYHFDVYHRRIIRRNLQFSHPDWSPDQTRKLLKRFCIHFGITTLEILQMSQFSSGQIIRSTHVEGKQHLMEALARKKGVVLVSGHIGNWEMAWQIAPCYFNQKMFAVAKKMRNPYFDRFLHNLRTRFGNQIIYKKGALPDLMKALRQGKIIAILMDISRRFEGVEVRFLGRRATATPAAALLALRCKSPILPAFCHRNNNGELVIRIEPPVELTKTNNLRIDLQTNTQVITERVERAIRKNPDQWFWTLKRWKDFYPGLYSESTRRLKKIKKKEKKKVIKSSRTS
jgi:KDO2-lipid IV(A) lauroyltransferase